MKSGTATTEADTTLTEVVRRLLIVLSEASEPLSAIELARRMNLTGPHESARRVIRMFVDGLRRKGFRVCASLADGYWLARDDGEWREYLEAVKSETRFRFVRQRRVANAATDRASGQGALFEAGAANDAAFTR